MAFVKGELEKSEAESLAKALGVAHILALPRLEKIVVNMGVGKITAANIPQREKILEEQARILSFITGQKPAPRRARKSIAGFKVREGDIVGYVVTLRGKRMQDFLTRFFNIALPRSRDFRGIPRESVDQHGNLTVGIREHIVFPEAAGEETKHLYGMEITIVPTTRSREKALALYAALGFPFAKE